MTETTAYGIRLETGMLPEGVQSVASDLSLSFSDVTGFGVVEWVELAGTTDGDIIRLEGPFQLIDLKGRIRLAGDVVLSDFVCTISRHTDNGIQLLGGALKRAEVRFVELTFLPLATDTNDTAHTPIEEPKPAVVSLASVAQSSAPSSAKPQDSASIDARWGKAIAESDRVQRRAEERGDLLEQEEVRPIRGDIVNHRQFGKCTVVRVGDDHVTLRKPDRRNVQLGLAIVKFIRDGEEEGKPVYSIQIKPRQ
ncbi:MAG: hypothetical protein GY854_15410 [Deltaproteobacteria bacterium]|nr:hypothetical protein [Deltaproteobacteria bacterium]